VSRGYLYGLAAYLSWGFFPIYFKHLMPSSPVEILAHRIIWSALFVALLLSVLRRWSTVAGLLRQRRTLTGALLASALIGANWGIYIYGVNAGRVVETSLGYFINPLVSVLFGVALLGERLRVAQWAAVGVGAVAVAVLTVEYGHLPYIALALAATFGCYGLVKKRLGMPPAEGLLIESSALVLPAAIALGWLGARGETTVGQVSVPHTVLTLLGGAITAIPLMSFAEAANRIPLTAMGILQYVTPVIQLCVGVFLYHEPMPAPRLAGFALVWLALAVFTWDTLRAARRRARSVPAATGHEVSALAKAR
jgi:chloramphenicol-sensitive protein RarD